MSIHPEGGKYFFTFSLKKDLITIFKNIQKYSNAPLNPCHRVSGRQGQVSF
jgi:hypothetical protein